MIKRFFSLFTALLLSFTLLSSANGKSLKDIKKGRKISIGVKYDFPPFGYLDEKGDLKGFDIQMANYIAQKIGIVPEFRRVTSKDRIMSLLRGDIDIIIASMTKTPYRAKMINFTNTYFVDGMGILTSKNNTLKNESELNGKIIAVIMGSTAERYVNSSSIAFRALSLFRNYTEAVSALKEGKIDAIITDFSWCSVQEKNSEGTLVAFQTSLTSESLGIGVKKDDSDLLNKLNGLIVEMWNDGTYEKMYNDIFGRTPDFNLLELSPR